MSAPAIAIERPSRLKLAFGLFLSLMVVLGLAVTAPAPAHAATDMSIDNVYFENDSFPDGSRQALHVNWSLPDNASAPATLVLDLPDEIRGYADSFTMVGPNGEAAGTCTVTAAQVVCEVDEAFIQANPYSVSGEFWFDVSTQLKNKEDTTHTFDFGEFSQTVEVEANPNWCTDNCEYTGQTHSKWGTYNNADDTIIWTVRLPAPQDGIEPGKQITVTDQLDTSKYEIVVADGYPRVREGGSYSYNEWGRQTVNVITKPASEVTWNGDHTTVSFESAPGWAGDPDLAEGEVGTTGSFYTVQWKVKALDGGKAGKYTNTASYTIEGEDEASTSGSATRYSGGATVVGQNFGKFQVTKELTGDTVLNPTFTVNYVAYDDTVDPNTPIDEGSFQIKSGQSYISDEYFKGTRIVLTEVQPTDPQNVVWETPVFVDADGNPITELTFSADNGNLGQITEIRLVNEANLIESPITARKVVENPDGVTTGVDSFRIGYSRENAIDKGIQNLTGGQFVLPADGTEVTLDLPADVGYSFFEWFTPAPAGTTWADPVYTVNGVEYTENELVHLPLDGSIDLTVTNTITQNVGGFAVTKSVSGEGESLVPEGTEFTVNYSYTAVNGFDAGSGSVTVRAGETSPTIEGIPEGAVVTLDEVTPVNPVGGTWGEPQFDVAEFTVVKDQVVQISLDNPITWNNGNFSIVKSVTGDGAGLVGNDVAFEIDYSYVLPEDLGITPGTGTGTLTVLNDGTAVTSSDLPYGTEVTLSEATPPAIAGGTWTAAEFDHSTFTIGDQTTFAVALTNTIERDLGSFSIEKSVTGAGAHLVPGGTVFTVDYSYPEGPGFDAGSGSVEVTTGEPAVVTGIPAGAVVTLTEATPAGVEGGTWQPAQFTDGNVITIAKDKTTQVGLENVIDLNTGAFSVAKKIDGTGKGLIGDDATFTVRYAYPAANGYEAGSGELVVAADGTAVSSSPIPYGAEVTLSEDAPGVVQGGKWTGAKFSTDTVTIGDGTVAEVVLTNTIAKNAATGGLPTTGAGADNLLAPAALLLLAAGGTLLAIVRRRKRNAAV